MGMGMGSTRSVREVLLLWERSATSARTRPTPGGGGKEAGPTSHWPRLSCGPLTERGREREVIVYAR